LKMIWTWLLWVVWKMSSEHSLTLFRINCSQSSQPSTSLVYSDLFLAFTNFFE
jgi:hypothetical protein